MPRRHGLPSFRPADVEVAARLDHEVAQAGAAHEGHRVIDRVALADAAQVDAHALAPQEHRAGVLVDLELPVVDERQPSMNGVPVRDRVVLVVVELPHVGERAEGHVELAAGPLADLARRAQHVAHVRTDGNRAFAGRGVHPQDVAPVAPDAHQRVQPVELLERRVERRSRGRFVGGPRREAQLGSHRRAHAFDKAWLRWGNSALPARGDGGNRDQQHRQKLPHDEPQRAWFDKLTMSAHPEPVEGCVLGVLCG